MPLEAGLIEKIPAIGWSYQANFGGERNPRSLVAQLHVPIDCAAGKIDELLDMIRTAVERQAAWYALQEALEAVEGHKARLRELHMALAMSEETARIEYDSSGRRGEWTPEKMSPAQQKARLGAAHNLKDWEAKTEVWKQRVAELTEKVHGNGLNGGADRYTGMSEGQDTGHGVSGGAGA